MTPEEIEKINEIITKFRLLENRLSEGIEKKQLECFLILAKEYAKNGEFFYTRKKRDKGKEKYIFQSDGNYFMFTFWDLAKTPTNKYPRYPIGISYENNKYHLNLDPLVNENNVEIQNIHNSIINSIKEDIKESDMSNEELLPLLEIIKPIIDKNLKDKTYMSKIGYDQFIRYTKRILDNWPKDEHSIFKSTPCTIKQKNIILFGPPGTGKTFQSKNMAVNLLTNNQD